MTHAKHEDPSNKVRLYDGDAESILRSEMFADRVIQTQRRLLALRERFFRDRLPDPPMSVVGCPEHRNLALLARARGEG